MDDLKKKRSPLWYELPLFLQVIGGIIAYFVLRKDDPKLARRCLILGILLTIPVLAIYGGLMLALSTDTPFYVVASGSMMPKLNVYDVAVIDGGVPFEDLQLSDIIVFHRPSDHDRVILHRIFLIDEDPRTIRTKGDNNAASIPGTDYPITEREYIGKVVYVIPQLGTVTQMLKPPVTYVIMIIVYLIPVFLHIRFKTQFKQD